MNVFRLALLLLCMLPITGCNYPAALPDTPTFVSPVSPIIPAPASAIPTMAPSATPPGFALPSETTAPPTGESTLAASPTWAAQVVLAEGRCCVGGVVGEPVEILLASQAQGPGGAATEMRFLTGGCLSGDEAGISEAAWQPFAPQTTVSTHIPAINWIGFWVSVQFRDAQGNLSPVVCDDISIEGQPAAPTTSP